MYVGKVLCIQSGVMHMLKSIFWTRSIKNRQCEDHEVSRVASETTLTFKLRKKIKHDTIEQ